MKQRWMLSWAMAAAVFLLPLLTVRQMVLPQTEEPRQEEPTEVEIPPFESGLADGERQLRLLDGETVETVDLGTYLCCVLRAEMPASFPLEALKAQAVAARTYTLYQLQGSSHHENADICTDYTCCQAYLSPQQAWENWGEDAPRYEELIRTAVRETDGEVMLYDAQPILAVFHSASAGLTRPSGEVWMEDLPYLQAVESAEEGEKIPQYYTTAEFTEEGLRQALLAVWPEMQLQGKAETWFSSAQRDEAGTVRTVVIGGVTVKGARVRSALGLRSACFTWEAKGDGLLFHVTGYGHGVGLSQYGAAAMADSGADYREILQHYYTGIEITGG